MNASEWLNFSFKKALAQQKMAMGQTLPVNLRTSWVNAPYFWAAVELEDGGYLLSATTTLAERTVQLWTELNSYDVVQASGNWAVAKAVDRMTQNSLVCLMLHELHHIDCNHFELVGGYRISETRVEPRLEVVQRNQQPISPAPCLPSNLDLQIPLCLELQADHDATEMLLGAYSSHDWNELRQRVMAIAGMMVLIEREDAKSGAKGRTHPKAATRIFQLLGHVSEMPLIEAQLSGDVAMLPSEEELQSFAKEVTIPCLFDAIHLAQVAGAETIAEDLGQPEDFFKDLEIAKLGDPSRYSDLKTEGAREWAKLWECNEALKPILGGHFTN